MTFCRCFLFYACKKTAHGEPFFYGAVLLFSMSLTSGIVAEVFVSTSMPFL